MARTRLQLDADRHALALRRRLAEDVRWTRHNRAVVEAARRLLREAYPANPRDALDAISGTATWPGPALLWARIDRGRSELDA